MKNLNKCDANIVVENYFVICIQILQCVYQNLQNLTQIVQIGIKFVNVVIQVEKDTIILKVYNKYKDFIIKVFSLKIKSLININININNLIGQYRNLTSSFNKARKNSIEKLCLEENLLILRLEKALLMK